MVKPLRNATSLRIPFFHFVSKFRLWFLLVVIVVLLTGGIWKGTSLFKQLANSTQEKNSLETQLQQVKEDVEALKNQDQYKINQELQLRVKKTDETLTQAADVYEKLIDLKIKQKDTTADDKLFAESLNFLAKLNYASASATLTTLADNIAKEEAKIAAVSSPVANAVQSNTPPGSGYSVQSVVTDTGTFTVSIIAADLNSTRVIVDTASESDCSNNCPVLPLNAYVSRSGAWAGINGTFFCPAEYPSCAGKTGSFDTLLMNKNKHYFNSDNNKYSTVPLVFFSGNQMGVREHSQDWGRDTGVDSVIAMQPLLVLGGNIVYGNSADTKFANKGTRNFIANKGNMVYIGVMYNANMTDSAHVLKTLGMDNALNLDEGGSTALWHGGYKAGPGRNIPNAVLFVKK